MLKKTIAKLSISLLLALTVLLPMKSSVVYAADSKFVTVYNTLTFSGSSSDEAWIKVSTYMTNNPTYYYNDGEYWGTLNFAGINQLSSSYSPGYYSVQLQFAYSGTVTKIVYTQNVTVTVNKSFSGLTEAEINSQVSNYIANNYNYYYNQNSYSGNLSLQGVQLISQNQNGSVKIYSFLFTYSGIVTKY